MRRQWIVFGGVALLVLIAAAVGAFSASRGGNGTGPPAEDTQGEGEPKEQSPRALRGEPAPSASDEGFDTGAVGNVPLGVAVNGEEASGPATGGSGRGSPALPDVLGRKIVRNASLDMEVEDVVKVVRRVEQIAVNAGGFVASSSVFVEPPQPGPEGEKKNGETPPPERTQTAVVSIRVPASQYLAVMNQLRGLAAEPAGETSSVSDVTEEFSDLQARLHNLEATEARYLELMSRATTISEILTLQDRINGARLEIERIQGRINLLNDLTDLATIEVRLRPFVPAEDAADEEPGWAQEAADDAWESSLAVMRAMGTAAIVGGVVLAWVTVPLLGGLVAWRLFGPRRPPGGETA
ncbi:MAG: DUF4349 domain-containing protein [Chloroflexi bacterium]|nr:DUF4349 domain-containing protein [Chloroflexota bacterium]